MPPCDAKPCMKGWKSTGRRPSSIPGPESSTVRHSLPTSDLRRTLTVPLTGVYFTALLIMLYVMASTMWWSKGISRDFSDDWKVSDISFWLATFQKSCDISRTNLTMSPCSTFSRRLSVSIFLNSISWFTNRVIRTVPLLAVCSCFLGVAASPMRSMAQLISASGVRNSCAICVNRLMRMSATSFSILIC